MSTTKRIAAALLLVGIASSASAATPSDSSVSNDGWTDFGTGMEYKFMSTPVNYDDALASCSSIGPEHTLASPFTAEQAALLVGFAPATAFIGLKNKLEGQPKPCRDFAEFEWESGAPFNKEEGQWASGEPNDSRCKEKCGAISRTGMWSDVKCFNTKAFICQRPKSTEIHELQTVSVTQSNCGSKPRHTNTCVESFMLSTACDLESLSVTSGLLVSATVREPSPSNTQIGMNGATPMQSQCISDISNALIECNPDCNTPGPVGFVDVFTSCTDGVKNGAETGVDCGGNDCGFSADCEPVRGGVLNSGGDPHYVATLSQGINLCYDVHGAPGDVLNLISGKTLLVNTLVIGAKNSVSGTYHGALGMVALSPDGSGRHDSLAVLADGTVRFNGIQLLSAAEPTFKTTGAEMVVSVTVGKVVTVSFLTSPSVFTITFIAAKEDEAHLDLNVVDQRGLNGTHGIIGQFIHAPASIYPKDATSSILTVSGRTVEVISRQMPQVSGADQQCYKYVDLQASGIMKGSVSDYIVEGVYQTPAKFNLFHASASNTAEVDAYVRQTAALEHARVQATEEDMRAAAKVFGVNAAALSGNELRNTLIVLANKHLGFELNELQSVSNRELARRSMIQV